jgi:hypothetical protein
VSRRSSTGFSTGLSAEAWRVLRALDRQRDAALTGQRLYPHPYHFTLHQPAINHRPASSSAVASATIDQLVRAGCIEGGHAPDVDHVTYVITGVGRQSLKDKRLHPLAGTQLDWVLDHPTDAPQS